MDGTTGATIPFSTQDNGADLVETSYMMQGLLTARQYFNTSDPAEIAPHAASIIYGMALNGTGSAKADKMYCTGTGVPTLIYESASRSTAGMKL